MQHYFCGPDAVRSEKLQKREKKQRLAADKAMVTLKIQDKPKGPPTMSNVYKELMHEANRDCAHISSSERCR